MYQYIYIYIHIIKLDGTRFSAHSLTNTCMHKIRTLIKHSYFDLNFQQIPKLIKVTYKSLISIYLCVYKTKSS